MGDTVLGIFQETLIRLIRGEWQLISMRETELIIYLNEDISYMRGFLKLTEKKRYKHPEVMNLVEQIKDIVSEAENIIEFFVVQEVRARNDGQVHPSLHLGSVIEEIKTLTAEIKQICDEDDVNGVAAKKLKKRVSKTKGEKEIEMDDTTLGILQKTLIWLIEGEWYISMREREQILSLNKDIRYITRFLMLTEMKRYMNTEEMDLVNQIKDVVLKAENSVEILVVRAVRAGNDGQVHPSLYLGSVIEDIKTLTAEIEQIYDENIPEHRVSKTEGEENIEMDDIALGIFQETLIWLIRGEWQLISMRERELTISLNEDISCMRRFLILFKTLVRRLIRGKWQLMSMRERELIISLNEDISYMRGFLKLTEKKRYKYPKVMNLVNQIKYIVFKVDNIVENFVLRAVRARNDGRVQPSLYLGSFIEEIKTLTAEIKQICDEDDVNGVADKKLNLRVSKTEGGSSSLGESNTSELGVVGFDEEENKLLTKLHSHGDSGGVLEIIEIIGAGGSGKTTLVKQVYEHQLTKVTFVRAWVTVSQDYDNTMKRNLLIPILKSTSSTESGDYEKKSDDDLGEEILKCLKGKKYLIVMDDMWSIEAWNDIQRSFPRECNGSKVLFTSRLPTEPNNISYLPHHLDPLTESYSWELLQKKVFGKNHCPLELDHIGKHIVEKCEGLPLAIVTVARILVQQDKTPVVWKEVDKKLSSIIAENSDNCMKILELSYNHLPKWAKEKEVVGFKEEVDKLLGTLCGNGEDGPLEIISIIGAAGGGKTTLVGQVYDHPLMLHNFEIRAWLNVSQEYDMTMKRNLLIRILELALPKEPKDYEKSGKEDNTMKSTSSTESGDYEKMSDGELGEEILKCLKGKKYLIVMDDIWSIEAWNDIQRSFPRERNGSKVLFTSRLLVEPDSIRCIPHFLKPLPKSCSWELLQNKVFTKKCSPPELVSIGEHIAEKCEGLPLAIVTIAGILAMKDKTPDVWEKFSECLSSIIAKDSDNCMKILELSYNHLPLHLKACFLYIGGFPEDSEISVHELIWLWIAEGFIQESEGDKSLEDIARDYLQNLIERSLIMEARKRSYGGTKACRIHDLLRELCLIKAEEDNFLVQIYGSRTFSPNVANKQRRLFIGSKFFPEFSLGPCARNLRSFMCLSLKESAPISFGDLSFFTKNFELLRVLHLISVKFRDLGEGHLVHLRYLALELAHHGSEFLWSSLYLFNLETLYIRSPLSLGMPFWLPKTIHLPPNILKMVKLRHLYAKRGAFEYHHDVAAGIDFGCSSKLELDSLQTLHSICPCEKCLKFLRRTPNLRKLGFWGNLISDDYVLMFPDLEFLKRLETLSFVHNSYAQLGNLPSALKFPPTVTRLTLKNTVLKWEALSILQTLPSLEVLKLLEWSCIGKIWDTPELSHLKYLKMECLYFEEWNASEDQCPRLEVLVVRQCSYLKRIPIDFANLIELREIDVRECGSSRVRKSATEIQEERRNTLGNDGYINLLT